MNIRCHTCGHLVDGAPVASCDNCGFALGDGRLYKARLEPADVPGAVAERVVQRLAELDADGLATAVPLLRTGAEGLTLIEKLGSEDAPTSLEALYDDESLSAGLFSELVVGLGVDYVPYAPFEDGEISLQPANANFSASRTEVEFKYEVLKPGPLKGHVGVVRAARCTSCAGSPPVFNSTTGEWETRVDVTKAIMEGQDDLVAISITMDTELHPFDYMAPINRDAAKFQFPAAMHLNNNMLMRVRVKGLDNEMLLASRAVPRRVGVITHWPPWGMRLHSTQPVEYFERGNEGEGPVLRVAEGVTFLEGPSNFLGHRADIVRHGYSQRPGELGAADMEWVPVPEGDVYERQADYYVVQRSLASGDEDAWADVSGPITSNTWTDHAVPQQFLSLRYRVVPVWKTIFDEEFFGFPGHELRVDAPGSASRPEDSPI